MNISNEAVIYCEYEARYQISQVINVTLPGTLEEVQQPHDTCNTSSSNFKYKLRESFKNSSLID